MIEDIVLETFPRESGVYLFSSNNEVIYIGSSKNLYQRMTNHISSIRKGSNNGHKQELYQFLQKNHFTVEFHLTDNYRQLEQELVERYHPKYNSHRAYTGLAWNGNKVEYNKEHYQKYKEEISEQKKQYDNQLCLYNSETLTLCALRERFKRQGIPHPQLEAKKYLIRSSCND